MSPLLIDCPSCSRKLRVPGELLGKAVKCPTCDHTFEAPAALNQAVASFPTEEQQPPVGKHRDVESHRGVLILAFGILSIVMCGLGLCSFGVGGILGLPLGLAALGVLGICSFGLSGFIGLPLGIAAWVMGRRDLIQMNQDLMDRQGRGLTQAGWICGMIGTFLDSFCSLGLLIYVGILFTMFAHEPKAPPRWAPAPIPKRPPPAPAPGEPGDKTAWQNMRRHGYSISSASFVRGRGGLGLGDAYRVRP